MAQRRDVVEYSQDWYRARNRTEIARMLQDADPLGYRARDRTDADPLPVIDPKMLEGAPECSEVHQSALLWPRPEDVDEDNEPGGRGTA